MNELQVFKNEKFGTVRTITENGRTLFCAKDIANALGYKDTTNAIKQHCRWVVKRHLPHPQSPDKIIEMTFIPEGDIYRLAAKSQIPGADEFERWIFVPQALLKKPLKVFELLGFAVAKIRSKNYNIYK